MFPQLNADQQTLAGIHTRLRRQHRSHESTPEAAHLQWLNWNLVGVAKRNIRLVQPLMLDTWWTLCIHVGAH